MGVPSVAQLMAEHELRVLVENAPDGIVVSRDGIILYANAAAARLLGYDAASELIGKPMTFLDPRAMDTMRRRIQQMRETGEVQLVPREYPARRRDGTEIVAEIASTLVEFEGAPAVLAYARDVTDRTRLRAQLAHADRLASLGMMAAGLAHEINNPLTFIALSAEALARRLEGEDAKLVKQISGGLDRIQAIVRDLRVFGRYEDEVVGSVELARAIEAAVRLAEHEVSSHARVVAQYGDLPNVIGIERQVEQVFVNLFLNAAHAFDDRTDGQIVISANVTAERVVVSVRDDGCGIPPDKIKQIFEPFFTMRARGGGMGLGLSICRDILARNGGDITVTSTLGEGTTMEVSFTRADAAARIPSKRRRVLVVDDEPNIVSSLVSVLSSRLDVVGETDSVRALKHILGGGPPFDVIVCDVMMNGLTGAEIHERVARERPGDESRFVFVTGGAYAAREREYLDRVPNERLAKPFAVDELFAAIDRVPSRV